MFNVSAHAITLPQNCASVSEATCNVAHKLGPGINMGNMLDAPLEGDWGIRLEPRFIQLAKDAGFKTLRIPVRWSNHAAKTEDATIDEFFFNRVEKAIDSALDSNTYVIINVHHYTQLNGKKPSHRNEFTVNENIVQQRFLNIWRQLSNRFKNKSANLIFEILNEPHGKLEGDNWYRLMNQALKIIRETNPERVVMIAPSGNRVPSLHQLTPPNDKNIIVAIHNYDPFPFTHQGFSWMPHFPKGVTCCDNRQKKIITQKIKVILDWNKLHGVPVHLGEFGAADRGDLESRVNYTRYIVSLLNTHSIGWTYWEFGSHFGVYNRKKDQWILPLRNVLLPPTRAVK